MRRIFSAPSAGTEKGNEEGGMFGSPSGVLNAYDRLAASARG